MKTFLAVLLLASVVAFAHEHEKKTPSLSGTTWSGPDSDGDMYTFTFERDGTLAYTSPTGSFRDGMWKQSGNAVFIDMNEHYSSYLGELNGNKLEGKAWNVAGKKWTWKVTLQK